MPVVLQVILVLLLLAVIVLAVIRIAARRASPPAGPVPRQRTAADDAMRTLNRVYAEGRMSEEEYHRRRSELAQASSAQASSGDQGVTEP